MEVINEISDILIWSWQFIWPILESNLKDIGSLMTGIAALKSLAIGKSYLKTKKIEAALNIQRSFEETIKYIIEIVKNPCIYEHDLYYPSEFPERGNKDNPKYPDRPARLIKNKYGLLKENLTFNIGVLGAQYKELSELENELDKILPHIYGYLQAQLGNHSDKLALQKQCKDVSEYVEQLEAILSRIKIILSSLIK